MAWRGHWQWVRSFLHRHRRNRWTSFSLWAMTIRIRRSVRMTNGLSVLLTSIGWLITVWSSKRVSSQTRLVGPHVHVCSLVNTAMLMASPTTPRPLMVVSRPSQSCFRSRATRLPWLENGISPHFQQALITGTSSSDRATTTTLTSLAMGREYAVRAMSRILLQTWR